MARKFVYTPEDINNEFDNLWKALRRNRSADVASVNLGAELAPDTVRRNTIQFNENGNVWFVDIDGNGIGISEGGAGSGGIDDVLAEAQELTAPRTVEFNGNVLLSFDPTVGDEQSLLQAINLTGNDNYARVRVDTTNVDAEANLKASFNDDEVEASVNLFAGSIVSEINYRADTHLFFSDGVENGQVTLGESFIRAFNSDTADKFSMFRTQANATTAEFSIFANYNSGADIASIEGFAQSGVSQITYTSERHIFTLSGIPTHADDAAASGAGLTSGTLYKTTTGGSTFLKIVP